eukprot:COSAG05_NODE_232_length_13313_cov_677.565991_9_plen_511_part_00
MPRKRRGCGLDSKKKAGRRRVEPTDEERIRVKRTDGQEKKRQSLATEEPSPPKKWWKVAAPPLASQREAAYTCYVLKLRCPPPDRWNGVRSKGGTFALIQHHTGVSRKVSEPVLKALWAEADATAQQVAAQLRTTKRHGRFNAKIRPGTKEGDRLIGALTSGWGQRWTAAMTSVDQRTIGRTVRRFEGLVTKRTSVKTGKRDPKSDWAIARAAICLQFKRQLILGRLPEGHPLVVAAAAEGLHPRHLDGTLWVDEHCELCVLGGAGHHGQGGKTEYRFPMKDGVHVCKEDGGEYAPPNPETVPKYPATASGAFGVAAPTCATTSVRYAEKMQPISYTGKTVVGLSKYKELLLGEFKEKREAQVGPKGGPSPWAPYNHFNPYLQRYGVDWKQHLPKAFKYVCITDIMDRVIAEGNRIFEGSTHAHDWCIYHDRLSQWWEKDAQAYLAAKGFAHRQWRAAAWTNDVLTKYYKDMLMGDSPELMPLDSSLFNDLIEAIAKHVIATYHIPLPTK